MVHQPSGGAQGQATDIEIQAREILTLRKRLNEIYVRHTGQPIEAIERKLERDTYMSAEESRDFGLVDEVVENRPVPDEARRARPDTLDAAGPDRRFAARASNSWPAMRPAPYGPRCAGHDAVLVPPGRRGVKSPIGSPASPGQECA